MASSLRHFISDRTVAAASLLRRRRISLSQIRGCSTKPAVPRQASPPWLMLQPALQQIYDDDGVVIPPSHKERSGGAGMDDCFNFYNLAEEKVVSFKTNPNQQPDSPDAAALLVGSSHGWLVLHNRLGDGGLFLSNPITGENIKLPAILGRVEKVILTCDPHDEDCRALASFNGSILAFCSPGRSSEWTTRITGSLPYADLAYSTAKGLFFGLKNTEIGERGADDDEDLEAWDATDPSSPEIRLYDDLYGYRYPLSRLETPWRCNTGSYLVYVEDADKLLLVRRYVCAKYHNTYAFDVYAIERDRRELVLMDHKDSSSDGLALFVGPNHSLAVRGAAGVKPGCIYYTGSPLAVTWPDRYLDDAYMYGGEDIGICGWNSDNISSCYYPHDQYSRFLSDGIYLHSPPLWFTPSPL